MKNGNSHIYKRYGMRAKKQLEERITERENMKIKNTLNNCEKYTFSQNYGIINLSETKAPGQHRLSEEKAGIDVEITMDRADEVDSWKEVMLIYNSALKQIETKLEILNDEFQHVHRYNPIEHIKSRIKTSESIVKKLKKNGYESTITNMIQHVNDIAGIRVICSFTSDIYRIADMISSQKDVKVLKVKDYLTNPKASGYKSYHMIVTIPVYLSDRIVNTKVEIQIRTVAMDFWASLEHKIHYKFEGNAPEHIKNELIECAKMVSDLDARMLSLNEEIQEIEAREEIGKSLSH